MDIMTCPHCRRPSDRPLFFPRSQQIIFDFIWRNPWCSIKDIESAVSVCTNSNLIAVQISKIRDHLVGTPYRLASRPSPKIGRHRPSRQYRIEESNVPL